MQALMLECGLRIADVRFYSFHMQVVIVSALFIEYTMPLIYNTTCVMDQITIDT